MIMERDAPHQVGTEPEPPLAPPPVANWLRGKVETSDQAPEPVEAAPEPAQADKHDKLDAISSRAAFEQRAARAPIAAEVVAEPDRPLPTVSPEVTSAAAKAVTAEQMAAKPVAELLALPSATAAMNILANRSEKTADMADGQLMELARTIKIDGISLQQIFESHQIDKAGLRAVVEAYLNGASVEKQLTKEITENEKRFELDPVKRKQTRGGGLRGAASRAPSKILEKGASFAQSSQKLAGKLGRTVVSGAQKAQETASESSDSQHWAGIAAVVIIYSLILILWLTK